MHAIENLTAFCGQKVEPYRSNRYDFDDFQVTIQGWGDTTPSRRGELGDLNLVRTVSRTTYSNWEEARQACLKALNAGEIVSLTGRVFD